MIINGEYTYAYYRQKLEELASHGISQQYISRHRRVLNCAKYDVLGLRIPDVRKLASSVPVGARGAVLDAFFAENDRCFESVLFAGLVAVRGNDEAVTDKLLKDIIPLFDSWAHVDTVVPGLKWHDRNTFLAEFDSLKTGGEFFKRTYVVYLMSCCLDSEPERTLELLRGVPTGEYYADMAIAWLISEALVKHYDIALPVIRSAEYPPFVHNKAIQKACESFRIDQKTKQYLKTLKIK